jgi:predicted O-linked N-acetylglucosamine transferase (SPINDLY family)
MPHSFLPSDQAPSIDATLGADAAPPTRAAAGLPEDAFVFCAFSNSYKITPPFFDAWMRLLREIPRSVLWLREYSPTMRANLTREAASRGIARERLIFAPRMEPLHRHVSRYRLADLFLDTSPYGAHATAQEALRAGLPVLTCSADSMASRVAASLLTALGLPELITQDLGCYWRAACSLAKEPASLLALRRRLETALTAGSTFDPDAYRRALEEAFRLMWVRHESGQTAENLDVPPQSPHLAR